MDTDPLPMHCQTAPAKVAKVPLRPEIGIVLTPLDWRCAVLAFARCGAQVGPLQIWLDW